MKETRSELVKRVVAENRAHDLAILRDNPFRLNRHIPNWNRSKELNKQWEGWLAKQRKIYIETLSKRRA